MTDNQAPEDLGAPVAYLVLRDGTPAFDRSGDKVGDVVHVLADEREDVFHGLLLKTADGHRFASGAQVDGLFEHGVILAVPAGQLAEPSADPAARQADQGALKRAWDWLTEPK
jgi:hypothetical protein